MEIGVSTATLFLREFNENAVKVLDEIDARVTEVFLGSFREYKNSFAELIKSNLGNLKVHSVHTLNTHFEPQLFTVNERAKADAVAIFEEVLGSAKILGAKNYTMHGLIKFKRGVRFDKYADYASVFNQLCDLTEKYGVELTLENVEWALYNQVGFFRCVKPLVKNLKTCLDVKQARISGYDYRDYLDEMGETVNTVHLSDVDDLEKVVLPGKGNFDFKELFSRLKDKGFKGNMFIEVYKESFNDYDELKQSLEFLRNIKYEVFGNE